MEREEKLKAVRKKEQAVKLDRVSTMHVLRISGHLDLIFCRKEKRLGLHRRGKRRSGRKITHMTSFSKVILKRQITRIEGKTGKMISCRLSSTHAP